MQVAFGVAVAMLLSGSKAAWAAGSVVLSVVPLTTTTDLSQNFAVTIQVQAGTQSLDGAAAFLNFDPSTLQVVSITGGGVFAIELTKHFDNTTGQVDYVAGNLVPPFPSGTFTLASDVQRHRFNGTRWHPARFQLDRPSEERRYLRGRVGAGPYGGWQRDRHRSNSNPDGHTHQHANQYAHGNGDEHADPDPYPAGYGDALADPVLDCNADSNVNGHPDSHTDSDPDANEYADEHGNDHLYGNADRKPHGHHNSYADTDPNINADPDVDQHIHSDSNSHSDHPDQHPDEHGDADSDGDVNRYADRNHHGDGDTHAYSDAPVN